jgi:hypothetical protein
MVRTTQEKEKEEEWEKSISSSQIVTPTQITQMIVLIGWVSLLPMLSLMYLFTLATRVISQVCQPTTKASDNSKAGTTKPMSRLT